jgi:hypothetical protein
VTGAVAAARRLRERVRGGSLTHGFIHRTGVSAAALAPPPEMSEWRGRGPWEEAWAIRGLLSPAHAEPVPRPPPPPPPHTQLDGGRTD